MKKNIIYSLIATLTVVLFVACGTNNKNGNAIASSNASMSILLEGEVKFDTTRGCEKLFVVHAIDGNGNPIPGLDVDANIIINNKASGNYIGTMQTTDPISFIDNRVNFNSKNVIPGDKLIISPTANRHDASYLGDWDIYKVEGSRLSILGAAYNLESTDQLSYMIGNESIYVPGYGIAVAHVEQESTEGETVTNSDGYAYFKVVYDLSLINHMVAIGAHTKDGYRIGASVSGELPDCTSYDDSNTSAS